MIFVPIEFTSMSFFGRPEFLFLYSFYILHLARHPSSLQTISVGPKLTFRNQIVHNANLSRSTIMHDAGFASEMHCTRFVPQLTSSRVNQFLKHSDQQASRQPRMENLEFGGTACDVSEMIPTAELEAERLRLEMLHDYEDGLGNSIKGHHKHKQSRAAHHPRTCPYLH